MERAWNQVDPWLKAALIAWALLTIGVCVRSIAQPHRSNAAALWQAAGQAWLDGEALYPTSGDSALAGYRSSPVGACLFALLVPLPLPVAGVLFRVLATLTFVASAVAWMRWGLHAPFSWRQVGIALLLMLPLALTSLNSAQVNLFALALMLASLTAAANERWWLAGLGSALAGLLLLYPIGLALLLFLSFPRRFTLPFLVALALVASAPLLFHSPAYVLDQYLGWFELLAFRGMGDPTACRDLWHLFRTWHVRLGPGRYELMQLFGGLILSGVAVWYALRAAQPRHRLTLALLLSVVWVLILGPATNSNTYALIGPPLVWLLLSTGTERHPVTHHVAFNTYVVLLLCSLAGMHPLATRLFLSAGMQCLAVLYLLIGLVFLAFTWPEGEAEPSLEHGPLPAQPARRAA